MRDLEERISDAPEGDERRRLLAEYETLSHAHAAEGGYDVDRRIESVLSSLGLPETGGIGRWRSSRAASAT